MSFTDHKSRALLLPEICDLQLQQGLTAQYNIHTMTPGWVVHTWLLVWLAMCNEPRHWHGERTNAPYILEYKSQNFAENVGCDVSPSNKI